MKVEGELSKQAPIEYMAIHVIYEFKGKAENESAAVEAVNLSQEKYCGVSHMLKKAIPVTWEVVYNGTRVFGNKVALTNA